MNACIPLAESSAAVGAVVHEAFTLGIIGLLDTFEEHDDRPGYRNNAKNEKQHLKESATIHN